MAFVVDKTQGCLDLRRSQSFQRGLRVRVPVFYRVLTRLLPALLPFTLASQTSVLPSSGVIAGSTYGVTRSLVGVSGQTFSQATRVQTVTQPTHTYDSGLTLPTTAPIALNDVLAGELWIRRLTPANGEGFATFNFEKATADYDKSLAFTLTSDATNWRRFRFAFRSIADYPAGSAHVAIHLGFPPQTIELGGLRITNYAKTQPLSAFTNDLTYSGREPDAPWRLPAAARIAQIRQADIGVTVRDVDGFPVPSAKVAVRMKRHSIGFGSAVDATRLIGTSGTVSDRQRYQGIITNWFNKVVLENDLKWPSWESNPTIAKSALNWMAQRGIAVRGHNLLWPGTNQSYFLPTDVPKLFGSPTALRQRINAHFTNELAGTHPLCAEWDVVNEPYANHAVMDVLGNGEMNAWFQLAHRLEPSAVLYLNEYSNLERAGLNDPQTSSFFNWIQFLQDNSAPIGGIGMQGHFGEFLSAPDALLVLLDRFSVFGLPIQATEFDVNLTDEALQADYLRDFMTALFSHPSVNGILMWGFWEGQHWLPNAALIRKNWELKPNGVMWSNLVFKEWWTTTNLVTDAGGSALTRGFKGDYELTITTPDQKQTVTATLATNLNVAMTFPVSNPTLNATVRDGQVRFTWSANASGYRIEVTPDLGPPHWQPITATPVLSDGSWEATLAESSAEQFFRLVRP